MLGGKNKKPLSFYCPPYRPLQALKILTLDRERPTKDERAERSNCCRDPRSQIIPGALPTIDDEEVSGDWLCVRAVVLCRRPIRSVARCLPQLCPALLSPTAFPVGKQGGILLQILLRPSPPAIAVTGVLEAKKPNCAPVPSALLPATTVPRLSLSDGLSAGEQGLRARSRVVVMVSVSGGEETAASVAPVYKPTPPDRELRTPHSGGPATEAFFSRSGRWRSEDVLPGVLTSWIL